MKNKNTTALLATLLVALWGWGNLAQADTKVRVSSFEYDASGLLTKEVVEPNSANDCLQTAYVYDGYGNKVSSSAAACAGATGYAIASATTARTATSGYSVDGRFPLTSANALAQTETRVFDTRFGTPSSLTGPNGLVTSWLYDDFGRKVRETRSDNTYTTWTYLRCVDAGVNCPVLPIFDASFPDLTSPKWVLVEQAYAVNGVVNAPEKRQFFDLKNRVLRVRTQGFDGTVAAPALVQDVEYSRLDEVLRKSDWYVENGTPVWTTFTYNLLGQVTSESHPDAAAPGGNAVTTMLYSGQQSVVTNAKGQTKTTVKNAQGQVSLITDAQGGTITYAYDALGNLLSTNANGSVTSMTYNQRGQKVAMLDPAMGSWTYAYNVFGELVYQRDSLNQSSTMVYDVLGRMTQRTEPDLISDWSYDKKFDATACGKGIGKLCEAKSNNGYNRKHTYDTLGRPSTTATLLDSPTVPATVTVTYDANTGRVAKKKWPTNYEAAYTYTALGYLKTVTGGGTNGFTQTVTYTVQAINAQGQITQYRTGNLITTVKTHDTLTNRLTGQTATKDGASLGNVLKQTYGYDQLSNLITRTDTTTGVGTQEGFSYDSLNRLTTATMVSGAVSPLVNTEVVYDARGNIAYKSDVGRYWYDTDRPNRMTAVTLEMAPGATQALSGTRALNYAFDDYSAGAQTVNGVTVGNGNLMYTVSHDTVNNRHTVRGESYTSYNMPNVITYGNFITNTTSTADRTLTFVYGPEHQRIKQNVTLTSNGTSSYFAGNTWYLNGEDSQGLSYEKEIRANGTVQNKHYVSAGGVVFALSTRRTGTLNGLPANDRSYFQHDHLGSVAVATNSSGVVTERMAYDPWGKRRFVTTTPGQPDKLDAIVGVSTDRGYTMHEHLDEIGVVHMNGRIYDPLIGRFMSADPFIQSPDNLQSYNRYSYVLNNPLAYTDPSGYFSLKKFLRSVLSIAAAIYFGPFGAGTGSFAGGGALFNSAFANAAFAGGVSGAIGTGNLNGALNGAFSGALFFGVGELGFGAGTPRNVIAHAVAGCVSSSAAGGNCRSGALAGGFGEFAGPRIGDLGSVAANVTKSALLGGVGAVLGGGKFENGATTGAFGYLFNELLHEGNRQDAMKRSAYKDGGSTFQADIDYVAETGCMRTGGPDICVGPSAIRGVGNAAAKFFEGTTLADRVVGQMKIGDNHAFPASVDAFAARYGVAKTVMDSRGNPVQMLTVNGSYNGAKGTFEYIKNQSNEIYHRFFNTP